MKTTIFLALLSLLTFQYGCESYHQKDIQEQEDMSQDKDIRPQPVTEPERGNINRGSVE